MVYHRHLQIVFDLLRLSMKIPMVYMMTNMKNGTLYTGVTSNLVKRAYEHREGLLEGFTKEQGCKNLVYYEVHSTMESAILREKQIKKGNRKRKVNLINAFNSEWRDLFKEII